MNRLTKDEKHILELLKKDNFRGISKDNVVTLVSILDKVDPEVAKDLISKMPDAVRGMVEIEDLYTSLLAKGIESSYRCAESCFDTEDRIIDVLANEAVKDIPFEQKKYYVDQMVSSAKRKEAKDTEHRATIDAILKYGGIALSLGLCFMLGLFCGNSNIKLPNAK